MTTRLRLTFSKSEAMRYTSHLDLVRTWERTLRRAGLLLSHKKGFVPHPRIQVAAPLPLGMTSQCEITDFWMDIALPLPEIEATLIKVLPPGLYIQGIEEVVLNSPSLQTLVQSAEYTITLLDLVPDLDSRVSTVLGYGSIIRMRRGKSYDLRPLIEQITLLPSDETGHQVIHMRLTNRSSSTGRVDEVLAILEIPIETVRIKRSKLLLNQSSSRVNTQTNQPW